MTPAKENAGGLFGTPLAGRVRAFGQSPLGVVSIAKSAASELRSPLGDRTNSPRPSSSAGTPGKKSALSPMSAVMLQKCEPLLSLLLSLSPLELTLRCMHYPIPVNLL